MSSDAITQIILGLILIVGAVIGSYGIPLFSSARDWVETQKFYAYVKKAVEWANQTIPAEEWERKKADVLALCIDYAKNYIKINFTDEQIDMIIEAFVIEVKKLKKD